MTTHFVDWWSARIQRRDWWCAVAFFAVATFLGVNVADDYGIAWDEPAQHWIGVYNHKAAIGEYDIYELNNRDYGPVYEVALYQAGEWLGYKEKTGVYPFRHLMGHLLYLGGVFAFYALLRDQFGSRWFALAGAAILLLMPRLYAHSFFNSKDLPFLVANIWCLYMLQRLLERPHLLRGLLLAFLLAWTLQLRIAAAVPIALTVGFILLRLVRVPEQRWHLGATLLALPLIVVAFNYCTWPFLWEHPLESVREIWANMTHFRWTGQMRFMGREIAAADAPWYYLPLWMWLTIPLPTLALLIGGIVGMPLLILRRWKQIGRDQKLSNGAVWWVGGLSPIVLIVVQDSVVYDGWRHVYFCFPYLLLTGLTVAFLGWQWLAQRGIRTCALAAGAVGLAYLPALAFMIGNHPYQNVYFNAFVSDAPGYRAAQFEGDYWGTSSYEALRKLAELDSSPKIRVYASNDTAIINFKMLPLEVRERYKLIPMLGAADYYMELERPMNRPLAPENRGEMVLQISVANSPLTTVYRIKRP
ncbi:MAG: glycosyltransferase family 39 protein [Verrucomicrobiota bacterium JB022]|nr:glycosyltransferase family 39 protein [Verrucomicrobiota bacterium JB022]